MSKRATASTLGLAALLTSIALVACGDDSSLVVYSGRSETLVGPLFDQFTEATGISVRPKYAGTSLLAATLLEEGDRTPADVYFAQDPGGLGVVEGMLDVLPQSILDQVPSWAHASSGRWVGISGRARVVVYNTESLQETDLPDDLSGFTDPQWKGKLGWPPRNASFQTMVTAMRAVWGEARTREWLEGVESNSPQAYENNTATVAAVGVGEVEVGLVNHYYLYRFLAEGNGSFPARNYHLPSGGPGALVMVAGAGILANSENKDIAQQFIQFMLSTTAQEYFSANTSEYPLVEDIEAREGLIPLADIRRPQLAMSDLKDLQGTQRLLRELGIIP